MLTLPLHADADMFVDICASPSPLPHTYTAPVLARHALLDRACDGLVLSIPTNEFGLEQALFPSCLCNYQKTQCVHGDMLYN